jgi:hypothetical protein
MTEYDSFKNGTDTLLMDENHSSELNEGSDKATPSVSSGAHLDAERGVFVTSKGTEIALSGQTITSLMLERITNAGRPKIPMVEVTLLGKHKQMQANAHDPDYLALKEEWESEQRINILRYVFVVGAKGKPEPEFVEMQLQFFPTATDLDLKYLWVSSRLPDEDIDLFTEAVMGRTLTTAKGLEEAANSFPGSG